MAKLLKLFLIIWTFSMVSCRDDGGSKVQPVTAPPTSADTAPSPTPDNNNTVKAVETASAEEAQRQCLLDVCGPEEDYLATRVQGPFGKSIPLDVKNFLESEVKTRLETLSQTSTSFLRAKLNFIDRAHDSLRPGDFSEKEFGLLLTKVLIPQIASHLTGAVETHKGIGYVNFDKLPPEAIHKNPALFRQAVEFYNSYMSTKSYLEYASLYRTFGKYHSSVTGEENRPEAWEEHIHSRLRQIAEIKEEFGSSVFLDLDTKVLKKSLNEGLSLVEKAMFIEVIDRVLMYAALQETSSTNLNTQDLKEVLKLLNWSGRSASLHDYLKASEMSQTFKKTLVNSCNEAVVQTIASTPSKLKVQRAHQLLQGIKTAAKSAAAKYLQGEPLDNAKKAIEEIEFENPKSHTNLKEDITDGLDSLIRQWQRKLDVFDNLNPAEPKTVFLILLKADLLNPEELILSPATLACNAFKPDIFQDHATKNGKVHLSWQSTNFHQIGAGIIAHEIGHIVSGSVNLFKSKDQDYWKVRECSASMHKSISNGENRTENSARYQEEDWADAFATTTLKILNKTWPYAKNYACALTSISPMNKYSGNALDNPTSVDSHSTGMFRALQIHVGLGNSLPSSCQVALGEKDFQTMSKSCNN